MSLLKTARNIELNNLYGYNINNTRILGIKLWNKKYERFAVIFEGVLAAEMKWEALEWQRTTVRCAFVCACEFVTVSTRAKKCFKYRSYYI